MLAKLRHAQLWQSALTHLQDEEAVVVQVDALPLEKAGDLCEVAAPVVDVVIRRVVAVGCAGHHKGTVWDDIKCLFPLRTGRDLSELPNRDANRGRGGWDGLRQP